MPKHVDPYKRFLRAIILKAAKDAIRSKDRRKREQALRFMQSEQFEIPCGLTGYNHKRLARLTKEMMP